MIGPQLSHIGWLPIAGAGTAAYHIQESELIRRQKTGCRCDRRLVLRRHRARRRRGALVGSRAVQSKPHPRGNLGGTQVPNSVKVKGERTQPRAASPSATLTRATSKSSSRGIGARPPFLTAPTNARTQDF